MTAGPVLQSHFTFNVLQPKTTKNMPAMLLLVAKRENVHHKALWDFLIRGCWKIFDTGFGFVLGDFREGSRKWCRSRLGAVRK